MQKRRNAWISTTHQSHCYDSRSSCSNHSNSSISSNNSYSSNRLSNSHGVNSLNSQRIQDRSDKGNTRHIGKTCPSLVKKAGAFLMSLSLIGGVCAYSVISADAAPILSGVSAMPCVASNMSTASVANAPYYAYPADSMAVDLTLDGQRVLEGACAEIYGTIYVPVERFIHLMGDFSVHYRADTEEVTVTGQNLELHVQVGQPYITVNQRVLYTGAEVLSLRGWIFAPLSALAKAMNATLTVKEGWYQASLRSGDVTAVRSASQVYNSTDLYWLSRIISAEARGESLRGQIAVGNVILNRVRSREFPNTVKGVIFDTTYGTQFSPVANGTIYQEPVDSAILAAKICLEGYTISSRMLYFFNPAIATSSWIARNRRYIVTIGNHAFYE